MLRIIILFRRITNKYFGNFWIILGKIARNILSKRIFLGHVNKKIGIYGPFKLSPEFLFSDLEAWGKGHNNGFNQYIECAKTNYCILDIGAHVGLTILPASLQGNENTKIYGFEPSLRNYEALKFNVENNNFHNIVIENYLVGETDNTDVVFYETADISATSSIIKSDNRKFEKTLKKQVSIDSYCNINKLCPDLIKIDVEGAEIEVLKGACEVMKINKPTIFLSVHPKQLVTLGGSEEELMELIQSSNYEIKNIDGTSVEEFECIEYLLIAKEGL